MDRSYRSRETKTLFLVPRHGKSIQSETPHGVERMINCMDAGLLYDSQSDTCRLPGNFRDGTSLDSVYPTLLSDYIPSNVITAAPMRDRTLPYKMSLLSCRWSQGKFVNCPFDRVSYGGVANFLVSCTQYTGHTLTIPFIRRYSRRPICSITFGTSGLIAYINTQHAYIDIDLLSVKWSNEAVNTSVLTLTPWWYGKMNNWTPRVGCLDETIPNERQYTKNFSSHVWCAI